MLVSVTPVTQRTGASGKSSARERRGERKRRRRRGEERRSKLSIQVRMEKTKKAKTWYIAFVCIISESVYPGERRGEKRKDRGK